MKQLLSPDRKRVAKFNITIIGEHGTWSSLGAGRTTAGRLIDLLNKEMTICAVYWSYEHEDFGVLTSGNSMIGLRTISDCRRHDRSFESMVWEMITRKTVQIPDKGQQPSETFKVAQP